LRRTNPPRIFRDYLIGALVSANTDNEKGTKMNGIVPDVTSGVNQAIRQFFSFFDTIAIEPDTVTFASQCYPAGGRGKARHGSHGFVSHGRATAEPRTSHCKATDEPAQQPVDVLSYNAQIRWLQEPTGFLSEFQCRYRNMGVLSHVVDLGPACISSLKSLRV